MSTTQPSKSLIGRFFSSLKGMCSRKRKNKDSDKNAPQIAPKDDAKTSEPENGGQKIAENAQKDASQNMEIPENPKKRICSEKSESGNIEKCTDLKEPEKRKKLDLDLPNKNEPETSGTPPTKPNEFVIKKVMETTNSTPKKENNSAEPILSQLGKMEVQIMQKIDHKFSDPSTKMGSSSDYSGEHSAKHSLVDKECDSFDESDLKSHTPEKGNSLESVNEKNKNKPEIQVSIEKTKVVSIFEQLENIQSKSAKKELLESEKNEHQSAFSPYVPAKNEEKSCVSPNKTKAKNVISEPHKKNKFSEGRTSRTGKI